MESKRLTKYEKAKVIGVRATQLENGAKPNIDPRGETNARRIAQLELLQGKMPINVVRNYPDGTSSIFSVNELIYN